MISGPASAVTHPVPAAAERGATRMRLVALVVTHNRRAQLQRTVPRLLEEDFDAVLVVDNASTDGTGRYLRGLDNPRLHVVLLTENGGGAGGFERGLREVEARFDPDWCVLMDDDARPEPGVASRFLSRVAALERDGYEAAAAGVFYPDGQICDMNRPSRNPFWHLKAFLRTAMGGGRDGFHVGDADYQGDRVIPIDCCSFVGFFLSRKALARAGYPDGKLFIYGDDVIYTLRLSRLGGAIAFLPGLRFEHDCTTFQRGAGRIHRPMWKVYYNYRNGLLAYREAAGPVWFWLVLLVVVPKWALKARAYLPEERGLFLKMLGLAVRDALTRRLNRPFAEIRRLARHVEEEPPPPNAQPGGPAVQPAEPGS